MTTILIIGGVIFLFYLFSNNSSKSSTHPTSRPEEKAKKSKEYVSGKSIISLVKTILKKFGFDEFEVKIYLKEKSEQKKGSKKSDLTLFDNE